MIKKSRNGFDSLPKMGKVRVGLIGNMDLNRLLEFHFALISQG